MGKLIVDRLEVEGKRILVRVDFNVPLADGRVADDTRIRAALPTLRNLSTRRGRVVLISHLGRPQGKRVPELSLKPVAERLASLLEIPVAFCPETIGPSVVKAVDSLSPGEILLLENLRYHPGEEKNDPEFAASLASLADGYVSDAFGTVHRAHASTTGVARFFPETACGFLIANELEFLGKALNNPLRPFIAIIGGAKVAGKIGVIRTLLEKANMVLIGGAMAYTFLKAQGHTIGDSLLDESHLDLAGELLKEARDQGKQMLLPEDHLVASDAGPTARAVNCGVDIPMDMRGLDIGPNTVGRYQAALKEAEMILWNGPMGMFELEPFREGTFAIARAVAESGGVSIVGGGDSVAAINQAGVADRISHISTGGGASLEFLEGKSLPGIEVLTDTPDEA